MGTRPGFKIYTLWGMLWRLAVVAAVVVPLSLAGGYFAVEALIRTEETSAPDLLTLPVGEAAQRAGAEGFAVRVVARERTTALSPGHVMAQRPAPGDPLKPGATLALTVSTAPGAGAGSEVGSVSGAAGGTR